MLATKAHFREHVTTLAILSSRVRKGSLLCKFLAVTSHWHRLQISFSCEMSFHLINESIQVNLARTCYRPEQCS